VGVGGSDHEGFGTADLSLSCRGIGIDNPNQAENFALVNPSHA
jgi:hypothetical protein